jgi:MoxR-like ATPase
MSSKAVWPLYTGTAVAEPNFPDNKPVTADGRLPDPPGWRQFQELAPEVLANLRSIVPYLPKAQNERGRKFRALPEQVQMVNAALYLRRPLLVTGRPGTGKSSLAYSVARELGLGRVLVWSITTRTTLQDGLYSYDAIGRLQQANLNARSNLAEPTVEDFIKLGPLGTAFVPSDRPRVLLIDEIDKSDIDLPNNLLNIFEEGEFTIEELARIKIESGKAFPVRPHDPQEGEGGVPIYGGKVRCNHFPVVVMTSNGEKEFPPAFLRRCLRVEMPVPDENLLAEIVKAHFKTSEYKGLERKIGQLIKSFAGRVNEAQGSYATDQLLNAIYLVIKGVNVDEKATDNSDSLLENIVRALEGE